MKNQVFIEKTRFGNWWLWLMLWVFIAFFAFAFIKQIVLNDPLGSEQLSDFLIILFLFFFLIIQAIMFYTRLLIKVDSDGFSYQFRPWHKQLIQLSWEKIADAKLRQYSAMGEFGNYGTRIKDDTLAMVASGTKGVELRLKNGALIIVSSRKAAIMLEVIRGYLHD